MDFGEALKELNKGKRVARKGWNARNMWLWLIKEWQGELNTFPNPFTYLETLPFIVIKTAEGKLVPWIASQTDILANDWKVIE